MREFGVVGGTAVPHAPQFFSLPATEDRDQVGRIERLMADIGHSLRSLKPDVVVIAATIISRISPCIACHRSRCIVDRV
jgi:hypothetical protein